MALLYLESGVCMLFHLSLEWFIHIPSVAQLLAVGTAVNIEFTPSIFSLFSRTPYFGKYQPTLFSS